MAWSLIAHTAAVASSDTTVTTTAIDTTGATLIVVFGAGNLAAVLTDSASNTNVYRGPQRPSSGGFGINSYFLVNPTTSATHTFTYAIGSAFPSLAVQAYSGSYGGVELWKGNFNASATSIAPGSITPTSDNALLVAGYTDSNTSGTISIDAGYTMDDQLAGNAHCGAIAGAHLIQTSAAAANPTFSTTAGATSIVGVQWSFLLRPAGGGSAGGSYPYVG